jgi:hypothetical protein
MSSPAPAPTPPASAAARPAALVYFTRLDIRLTDNDIAEQLHYPHY